MCDNKIYQYNVFSLYRSEEKKETEIHFLVYKDKVPVLVQICREVIFLLEKIFKDCIYIRIKIMIIIL